MNYVSLNLGGKERGAKLGIGFLEKVQRLENINIQELFDKIKTENFTFFARLLYCSLVQNCEIKGEPIDFSLYDVQDWFDEIGFSSEEMNKFQSAFYKSIMVHLPKDAQGNLNEAIEELEGKMKPQKEAALTSTSGKKK